MNKENNFSYIVEVACKNGVIDYLVKNNQETVSIKDLHLESFTIIGLNCRAVISVSHHPVSMFVCNYDVDVIEDKTTLTVSEYKFDNAEVYNKNEIDYKVHINVD